MVARRVKIRMSLLNIQTINEYINILNNNLEERSNLFDSLTVGSKRFFQDEDICDVIEEKILPIVNYSKKKLRIWSVGCSTGQEVYSLTILILEYLAKNNINMELKVFATDIDASALNSAREGIYKKEELHQIPDGIFSKYFKTLKSGFRVLKEVREMIVFAKHDLLKDPPFSNLDLINCRNVLVNYNKKAQYNILYTFHYALNSDGFLIIGRRESLGGMHNGFSVIDEKLKIFSFKALELPNRPGHLTSLKSYALESQSKKKKNEKKEVFNNEGLIHKLLESQLKSGVLIDSSYRIIQIFNDVHSYLRISKGRFSDNFFANVSSDLALIITNSLKRLKKQEVSRVENEVTEMATYDDFLLRINKIIFGGEEFYLITFNSLTESTKACEKIITDFSKIKFNDILKERISFLEKELQNAQKKVVHKEKNKLKEISSLEKSNHQLVLSNEKLQTINEELYSINDEYESALKEQFQTTKDLKILINSLPIEGIYLDSELKITSLSNGVSKYTHLIEKDIGRSVEHLIINKHYPMITENLRKVLKTSKRIDRVIEDKNTQLMFRIESYPQEDSQGLIIIIINIDALLK
jgi:two-component system CheB/CheR fusion protein